MHPDITCLLFLPSGVRGDFKQKKEIGQQAVDKSGTGCWSHAFLNQKVRGQALWPASETYVPHECAQMQAFIYVWGPIKDRIWVRCVTLPKRHTPEGLTCRVHALLQSYHLLSVVCAQFVSVAQRGIQAQIQLPGIQVESGRSQK